MSRELRVFTGSAHPALGEAIARFLGMPARPRAPRALQRRRDLVPDPGQRARRRRVRGAADVSSGQREPDGAAGHDRRVQALAAPRASRPCSRTTATRARTARTSRASRSPPSSWPTCSRPPAADRVLTMDLHAPADPGLLRRARRPPVRGARDHGLRREAEAAEAHRGLARRRRRRARARLREAAGGDARHRRQAPRVAERGGGAPRDRRGRGPHLPHRRRHGGHRRARWPRSRRR